MVDVLDPPDLPQFLDLRDPWEVEACSVLLSSGIQPAAYDLALASLQYSEALEPAVPGPREESDAPNTQHAQAACEHNSRVSAVPWAMPIQDEWTPNDAAEPLHLPDLAWMCSSPMSSPTFMFLDDGAADSAAMPFQPLKGQLMSGSSEDHSEGNHTSKRQKRSAAACDGMSTCITTAAAPIDSPMLRSKHIESSRDMQLKSLLASYSQRQDPSRNSKQDSLSMLQSMSDIVKLPGSGKLCPSDRLRMQSVQGILVHPGWHAVIPCQVTMQEVYTALEGGNLDLPINLKDGQGQSFRSLRELMAIPSHQQVPMLRDGNMRVVNAIHFKRSDGDHCYQTMLTYMGVVGLLGTVFFKPAAGLNFQGKNMLNGSAHRPQCPPDQAALKESVGLDGTQSRTAQKVWRDASQAIAKLKAERADILSRMDPSVHDVSASQTTTRTCQLLQQVAELTENAQLQLEVARSASRKFVWQVCSPDSLARLTSFYWPVMPDLMHSLQAVASA